MRELSGQIGLGSQEELLNELVELDELRSKVALKHGKQLLADAKELALVRGVDEVAQLQRHGNFIETLADFDADLSLLVMGKSGEEHSASSTIGSQLESVVRSIKSDIFVVSEYFNPPNAYMIAFDASDASELLIEKVIKSPLLASLECHLVMVSNHGDKSLAFEGAAERLKQAGLFITQSVLTGAVDEALLSYQQQQQLDMIVMGAYSHTRLRQYFVGSNTTQVLAKSIVPLLIMR